MIKRQLGDIWKACSAMFLVEEFCSQVKNISVLTQPLAAIAREAAIYGLSIKSNLGNNDKLKCVISSRIFKYTYGVEVFL